VGQSILLSLFCSAAIALFSHGRRPRLLAPIGQGFAGRIVRIGSFSALRMLTMNLSRGFLVGIVSAFGTFALAAFGIGLRLRIFSITLGFSLGDATSVVVGQNLGASQPERAVRSAWISVGFFGVIVVLLSALFLTVPRTVIGIFNTDPEVLRMGTSFLSYFAPALLMMSFAIVLDRAIDGAGDTMATMVITAVSLIGIGVPVAWGLSRLRGVEGVWVELATADVLQGLGMILYFRTGRWKPKALWRTAFLRAAGPRTTDRGIAERSRRGSGAGPPGLRSEGKNCFPATA
jgi:Na+-driven multidrug efflux pump